MEGGLSELVKKIKIMACGQVFLSKPCDIQMPEMRSLKQEDIFVLMIYILFIYLVNVLFFPFT